MKRGIKWRALDEPVPLAILGVPIVYEHDAKKIATAKGWLFWKRIVVGPWFLPLPQRERHAVLLHEAKHCLDYHLEKRMVFALWRFWTKGAAAYCHAQEVDADRFVRAQGYGADLARLIMRVPQLSAEDDPFHPTHAERINRLREMRNEAAA